MRTVESPSSTEAAGGEAAADRKLLVEAQLALVQRPDGPDEFTAHDEPEPADRPPTDDVTAAGGLLDRLAEPRPDPGPGRDPKE